MKEFLRRGSPYIMISEIHEQPAVAHRVISSDEWIYKRASEMILESDKIIITGSGSSYHAGLFLDMALKRISLNSYPVVSSEHESIIEHVGEESVIIAISQSGFTKDTLEAVKKFKEKGGRIIAVTNAIESPLSKSSDHVIYVEAGREEAVTATKSFTGQVVSLMRVYSILLHQLGRDDESFDEELRKLPSLLREHINKAEIQVREIVDLIYRRENAYILGRGFNYVAALESALKIKETCGVHAEALPMAEVRHGPKSAINESYIVSAMIGLKDDIEILGRIIEEIRDSGSHVIIVSPERYLDLLPRDGWISHITRVDTNSEIIGALMNIVVFQLFSYYIAVSRLLDPDYPRRLGKIVF
ncbi:MAG: SIS domain-containing protein [Sulfolobales archaeon]